jgi:hypothetical protein
MPPYQPPDLLLMLCQFFIRNNHFALSLFVKIISKSSPRTSSGSYKDRDRTRAPAINFNSVSKVKIEYPVNYQLSDCKIL